MSRPVRERLAELSADVEQVRLAPAAAVRARGRSRTRRRWAGTGAALATAVAAAGFGVAAVAGGDPSPVATLPAAAPSGNCDLALPSSPGEVTIQVIGGADQAGQVAGELGARGFAATGTGWIDPDTDSRGTVAVIRYGPRAIGDATLVGALVSGGAVMKFVPERDDRTVELVLGSKFRQLATTTEVNMNLVEAGEPTRPPGC